MENNCGPTYAIPLRLGPSFAQCPVASSPACSPAEFAKVAKSFCFFPHASALVASVTPPAGSERVCTAAPEPQLTLANTPKFGTSGWEASLRPQGADATSARGRAKKATEALLFSLPLPLPQLLLHQVPTAVTSTSNHNGTSALRSPKTHGKQLRNDICNNLINKMNKTINLSLIK